MVNFICWGILVVVGSIAILMCLDTIQTNRRNTHDEQDQLIFWPERDYQSYCEGCGHRIEKQHRIANYHFDAATGQPDVKRIQLIYTCPGYQIGNDNHYYELVDEYTMLLSGVDKWKRKN